jgi:hypothetical protein
MKTLAVVFALSLMGVGASQAIEACDGCEIAESAQRRTVGKAGTPEKNVACFYLSMPDQCDSVAVEADGKGFGHKHIRSYPVGAAVAMVSQAQFARVNGIPTCKGGEKAMICVPASLRTTVTTLRLIPGNKGTCNEIKGEDLARLWRVRTIPPGDPARLGWPSQGDE